MGGAGLVLGGVFVCGWFARTNAKTSRSWSAPLRRAAMKRAQWEIDRLAELGDPVRGPQGREFIGQALGAGHAVRALARNPSALQSAPSLEVVRGDVFDPPRSTPPSTAKTPR
jgi:NAD(P)H-binding